MLKKLSKSLLLLLFVFSFLFVANPGHMINNIIQEKYPEHTITTSDFDRDLLIFKDFTLLSDGSIVSSTADPWIYITFDTFHLDAVKSITINIEEATNLDEVIEIYTVESYKAEYFTLKNGANDILLKNVSTDDIGIRLDITAMVQQTLKISSIVINDNAFLTSYYLEKVFGISLLSGLALLAVCLAPLFPYPSFWNALTASKQKGILFLLYTFAGFLLFCGQPFIALLFWFLCQTLHINHTEEHFSFYMLFGFCVPFALYLPYADLCSFGLTSGKLILVMFLLFLCRVSENRTDWFVSAVCYLVIHSYLQFELNEFTFSYYVGYVLFDGLTSLNILLYLSFLFFVQQLFGRRFGNLIFHSFFGVYIAANMIKMHFQNSLLSLADFSLIGEVVGIADQYISTTMAIALLIVLLVLIALTILFRKQLMLYFKPKFAISSIFTFGVTLLLSCAITANFFAPIGIHTETAYLTNRDQLNNLGFATYTLLEFSNQQTTNEPDHYNETLVSTFESYKETTITQDNIPVVILILAESLFDIDQLPNVTFNTDLLSNLPQYKAANIVSPSYGGRTAAAEFEALTGLNNLFISGDTIAYTSYLNKEGFDTGSIAREFKDNGYHTVAIHANRANYYNRDIVYQNMGFHDFISIEDFNLSSDDFLKDGLVSDEAFVDQILEVVTKATSPTFIFGASIEGHSPYNDKYEHTEIMATSSFYSEEALYELSRVGQSIYNFDQQMGRLFQFFEESDTPAIIYVYGDHLPPLTASQQNGYLEDDTLKYTTPLYIYSNCCDTTIEEDYLSLSYIAPDILKRSGVSHRAYFDYINQLRKTSPIIHSAFSITLSEEQLQNYQLLQYDLLYGSRYLLKQ